MEEKRSKYDTDPLDPNFAKRTEEISGATGEVARTGNQKARQSEFAEAPTRYMEPPAGSSPAIAEASRMQNDPAYSGYQSVFAPAAYQPPANRPERPLAYAQIPQNDSCRVVSGVGLPERITTAVAYFPFYIGFVASLIELFLIPRQELRARFHASQALALHVLIIAITLAFRLLSFLPASGLGGLLFRIAAFIFLIISVIRVFRGADLRIIPLKDAARWLNERIEPRK